tara:strand:- start:1 stop:483 length:483 start_codon:yes stop_codon:yes gene_type:complete
MELHKLKAKALQNKKQNKKLLQKIKKKKGKEIDEIFNDTHKKVFSCTDCLSCANCCTTTGPLYTDRDIDRISKHLRLKPTVFIDKYLRIDEENDYVLQTLPCPFLGNQNYCSIYEVRPKACADYPHTDRNKQSKLLNLNLKNTEVCPAVFEIFEEIKKSI